jgi:hypothetical protein
MSHVLKRVGHKNKGLRSLPVYRGSILQLSLSHLKE